jgi:uncharacterized protein (TIGR02996 family)
MTDEHAFQTALDENPANHAMRLVFADWLEERGDWRAAGYRYMGAHQKFPAFERHPMQGYGRWAWNRSTDRRGDSWSGPSYVSTRIFRAISHYQFKGHGFYNTGHRKLFTSRQWAETALCKAVMVSVGALR